MKKLKRVGNVIWAIFYQIVTTCAWISPIVFLKPFLNDIQQMYLYFAVLLGVWLVADIRKGKVAQTKLRDKLLDTEMNIQTLQMRMDLQSRAINRLYKNNLTSKE